MGWVEKPTRGNSPIGLAGHHLSQGSGPGQGPVQPGAAVQEGGRPRLGAISVMPFSMVGPSITTALGQAGLWC